MHMIRQIVVRPVAGFIALSWSTWRFLRLIALVQRTEQGEQHDLRATERLELPFRTVAGHGGD